MALFRHSSYQSAFDFLKNGHFETIFPSIFRKIKGVEYARERIDTPDEDFLDLDWVEQGFQRLVIISHGLEGSTERHYVKSAAKYFGANGYDVLAWNYRSCGEEMNKKLRLYHHGVTDDLETVITHAIATRKYNKIVLVGFSMGGSTILKYLGEQGRGVPAHIVGAATFSVPCNLWDSAHQLTATGNWFYNRRFLKKMIKKVKRKHEQYPNDIDLTGIDEIVTFGQFDDRYTAPIHGFSSGRQFYKNVSSDLHYQGICVPALIVNAINDPLLGDKCYPYKACRYHQYLHLETPTTGGHVGFGLRGKAHSWMDQRALEFLSDYAML